MDFLLLFLALLALWKGTDLALEGALRISARFGVSRGFVGLTVLAIGTGLPELVVGVMGGLEQLQGIEASGVVVGNMTGSVVAQAALVLGASGLFARLRLPPRMIKRDGIILLLAIGVFALAGIDGRIGRGEGVVLIGAYVAYLAALVRNERNGGYTAESTERPLVVDCLAVGFGLVTVVVAAHVAVLRAISIAELWNVSQTVIGIFLVGAGTSLPELALSIRAAAKRHSSMSVGNVIGSNTFDLMVPVGASSVLFPLSVDRHTLLVDVPTMVVVTSATLLFLLGRNGLRRGEALSLLGLYGAYLVLRVFVV